MRAILGIMILAITAVTLGGCFGHHQKQVYVSQPAPPPVYKPLK